MMSAAWSHRFYQRHRMRPRPAVSCCFAASRTDALFLPAVAAGQGDERPDVARPMASARAEDARKAAADGGR